MDKYKFGEFIYQKRKALGLTQEELGYKLGVTNKAVSKWEVGETLPDVTILRRLAKTLGVSVDELLAHQDIKKENNKKIKTNKILLSLVIALILIEIITIIVFIIINNYQQNQKEIVTLTSENIEEVVEITPMNDFKCDVDQITIKSIFQLNDKYNLNSEEISFMVNYKINYYYYYYDENNIRQIGVITYYNRSVEVKFTSEQKTCVSEITLEPKNEIINFELIMKIAIDYEVTNCNGEIYTERG